MAKLNACSFSIHVTPSGNGLPSICAQVGRFGVPVAAGWAASVGRVASASTSLVELFTLSLLNLYLSALALFGDDTLLRCWRGLARPVPYKTALVVPSPVETGLVPSPVLINELVA